MNTKQKKFIREKLIPFILREKGQGFLMDRTLIRLNPGEPFEGDGLEHVMPNCGSAGCVYGSIKMLRREVDSIQQAAEVLGISELAAAGLFYVWNSGECDRYRWPDKHAKAFAEAKTPLAKAKVAVSLLREVVKTNGECLDQGELQ